MDDMLFQLARLAQDPVSLTYGFVFGYVAGLYWGWDFAEEYQKRHKKDDDEQ